MKNIQNILVPYDLSEISRQALQRGIVLSLKKGATLWVLYVMEPSSHQEIFKHIPAKDLKARLQQKIQTEIRDFISKEDQTKIKTKVLIQIGKPAIEILKTAEKEKADLIVLGTHGRSGVKHFLLGSVTERVVQRSNVPVLIHRGGIQSLPKKILIPIDFSESSQEALETAVQWAADLKAEIYLLHTIDLVDLYSYNVLSIPVDAPALGKVLKKEAHEKLGLWANKISTPHHLEVSIGNPVSEIQESIRKHSIDLVILATHGRTGLKHFLMGSVAEKVVHSASCSVLTVRPAQFSQSHLQFFKDSDELDEYMKSCESERD